MSSVDLRVELPAYSHSFQVRVQQQSSIQDVKQEIARLCPGGPRPDGQRLIWRGRSLSDEERVVDIWKVNNAALAIRLMTLRPTAALAVSGGLSCCTSSRASLCLVFGTSCHCFSHQYLRYTLQLSTYIAVASIASTSTFGLRLVALVLHYVQTPWRLACPSTRCISR